MGRGYVEVDLSDFDDDDILEASVDIIVAHLKADEKSFEGREYLYSRHKKNDALVQKIVSALDHRAGNICCKCGEDLPPPSTRDTVQSRCELAAKILNGHGHGIAWCHLNAEADLLEKIIPDAVQVSGSDTDDRKEDVFSSFRKGQIRVLVTKPKIAAFGMNWQNCHRMTYFSTHSFEQYYQAVRRCWRFGQKSPVSVDVVTSSAQAGVLQNLRRKSLACETMFNQLVLEMNDAISLDRTTQFDHREKMPSWL